jgi:hypothetical protein
MIFSNRALSWKRISAHFSFLGQIVEDHLKENWVFIDEIVNDCTKGVGSRTKYLAKIKKPFLFNRIMFKQKENKKWVLKISTKKNVKI